MMLRKLGSLAVPISLALVAFLHARAIGSPVAAAATPSAIAPFAEARAAAATAGGSMPTRSADALVERRAFDQRTGSRRSETLERAKVHVVRSGEPTTNIAYVVR